MEHWIQNVKDRSLHFSELIKGKLCFATVSEENIKHLQSSSNSRVHYLYVDNDYQYEPFFKDFGPLNLGMLYSYCKKVNTLFKKKSIIVHLTTCDNEHRVNSAFLVASYSIIYQKLTAKEVINRLLENSSGYLALKNFIPFVHAGFDKSQHYIYLEDCLGAIEKAITFKLLDFTTFNVNDYHHYEKIENGDLNWIVPNKLIAFCDPQTYLDASESFDKYITYFQHNNVTNVIRLNRSVYDAKQFTHNGVTHNNLIFLDGSNPNDRILKDFLNICEHSRGAVAVHCKAGLGRTGTLIACYLIKHYRFTAREAIAWLRICRPGSVVGPQQEWLESKQNQLWSEGLARSRAMPGLQSRLEPSITKCTMYEKQLAVKKVEMCHSHDSNKNNILNTLITNVSNIHLKDAPSCSSSLPSSYTQGDILNALKRNRNQTNKMNCHTHSHSSSSNSSIDHNNNFPPSSFTRNQVLRLYGKRIAKYPAPTSKVLPH